MGDKASLELFGAYSGPITAIFALAALWVVIIKKQESGEDDHWIIVMVRKLWPERFRRSTLPK
jgi:gamma-glutamylcysteine synthetase